MSLNANEITKFLAECKEGTHTKGEIAEIKAEVDAHLEEVNAIYNALEGEIAEIEDLLDNASSEADSAFNFGQATEDIERKKEHLKETAEEKALYTNFEAELSALLSVDKNFNKQNCFANIRALLKQNPDIKIGMIEKEAGIRLGYMARLEKPDNTAEPSMEFIITAAKMLGVTVDMLINGQIDGLNENERFVLSFLDTLIVDTENGDLSWEKETPKELENVQYFDGEPQHILMKKAEYYDIVGGDYPELIETRTEYNSLFFNDTLRVDLLGNVYHVMLPRTDTTIYIAHFEHATTDIFAKDDQYEVLVLQDTLTGLCGSCQSCAEIREQMIRLYKTIDQMNSGLGLTEGIKHTLSFYMKNSSPSGRKKNSDSMPDEDILPFE